MPKTFYLGIDLGGTNIKAGIIDQDANILSKISIDTQRDSGSDGVIDRMCEAGRQAVKKADLEIKNIEAIGIGAPGTLNHKKGMIISPPNLPDWHNVPVRDKIHSHFQRPATLENDANAAAWGEFWAGAGKGTDSLVMFTLGTGIGGGIITNGTIHRGFNDTAAEIGHMIIEANGRDCACGQKGCFEAYASAMSVAKIAEEAISTGRESSMKDILSQQNPLTAKIVEDHMVSGDPLACEIWDQTCKYLAIGCINIANVINPEMIVFAGGMAGAGQRLLDPVRNYCKKMRGYVFSGLIPEIVIAKLGNDAGIVGAAGAAKLACDLGEI